MIQVGYNTTYLVNKNEINNIIGCLVSRNEKYMLRWECHYSDIASQVDPPHEFFS